MTDHPTFRFRRDPFGSRFAQLLATCHRPDEDDLQLEDFALLMRCQVQAVQSALAELEVANLIAKEVKHGRA